MIKTLFETKLTDIKSTDVEGVGTLRYEDNGNVYRWVKNEGSSALTAKQPVCYDVSDVGTIALFQTVLTPATDDLMMAAGIAVTAIGASGAICYGWVLAQGYAKDSRVLAVSGTAVAVGDQLIPADGATTLTRTVAVGTAPNQMHTFKALETCSDATGATLAKDVYVSCL